MKVHLYQMPFILTSLQGGYFLSLRCSVFVAKIQNLFQWHCWQLCWISSLRFFLHLNTEETLFILRKKYFELIFSFLLCFYQTYMSNKIESDNIELNCLRFVLPILLLLESEETHRPTWKESYKQLYSDLQVPPFSSGLFILTTLKTSTYCKHGI